MKESLLKYRDWFADGQIHHPSATKSAARSLHLVSVPELQNLRHTLDRGMVPADFAAKLESLAGTRLGHHFIEQSSRLFLALLLAAHVGSFHGATTAQRERLLRVLAYVRKDDDAIPDPRPNGFEDDLHEVRTASAELAPLLQAFKRWRLEHQVPGLWLNHQPALSLH